MGLRLFCTPDQRGIVSARQRFLTVIAGRRWGKTATVRNRILYRTATPRTRYLYVAPLYAQCIVEYESLCEHPALKAYIRRDKLQPFPRIWLKNGSIIGFKSFEKPKSLRGGGLHEVWVDEIQNIKAEGFKPIIRPLISDMRGTLGISGQFRGHNWYYRDFFVPGQDASQNIYKSWTFPSSAGILFQSAAGREELDLAKRQLPAAVYAQEYDCIPAANQAAVFMPADLDAITSGEPRGPRAGCTYIAGVDLGRVVDHTAVVVLEVETGAVVAAEKFELRLHHATLAKMVARIAGRYGAVAVLDATGGATGGSARVDEHVKFYRKLMPDARTFYWGRQNKESVISALALAVEQRRITIPRAMAELRHELDSYEYAYRSGYYDYHAADGEHDDLVAALAQAQWGRQCGWGTTRSGGPGIAAALY